MTRCLLTGAVVFAAFLAAGGCQPEVRDRARVQGRATLGGQPLTGYQLTLFSEVIGSGGSATVQPDGSFELRAPIRDGEYVVYFLINADTKGEERARLEALGLPAAYKRVETSPKKVTINPGDNDLDIAISP